MNDDYLWDRSGEPDPDISRLEQLLGRYRHEAPLRRPRRRWLAVAAAIFLLVAIGAFAVAYRFYWTAGAAWDVVAVTGAPTIDGRVIDEGSVLPVGRELRTDARSRVIVRIARVGDLEIGPSSRVTLTGTRSGVHRMQLESGTLSARLWAPPFTFGVRTPAGLASDLGCEFIVNYANGEGHIGVTSGFVDFDGPTRSSLIPNGALADLRASGPGTPYYRDASAAFRAALHAFDFNGERDALRVVLAEARSKDVMTLLHLLEHADDYPEWRQRIHERAAQLAPPPAGGSIDEWRRSIGLGGIKKWWLHWRDVVPR
ncbi:MAG TPA: hypothetical protein VGF48_11115 [Thermoanaerobaculia bacterium]|jgi:hypothetical protein